MPIRYPGESAMYRSAREALLQEELALRAKVEEVAALRRALPLGGGVPQDYVFTAIDGKNVKLSQLVRHRSGILGVYSLMFRPDQAAPCPMCVSMLDGLNGQADHIAQNMDLVVVSAATPAQLADLAANRGWTGLTLLSAQGNSYQSDYNAEMADRSQLPMMNVFYATDGGLRHFWGSEVFFAEMEGHPRHLDQLWPLWNVLDLTPMGRGSDWFPALDYTV